MSKLEDDVIERYLYDVVRRLPEKQREDIKNELRTLIEDMIEERCGIEANESVIRNVLEELGSPAKLAAKYQDTDCLISGKYYEIYWSAMKMILTCVGAGILISNVVSAFVHAASNNSSGDVFSFVQNDLYHILEIPFILISLFGFITMIFIIVERKQIKLNDFETVWSMDKLPVIPDKKAVIKKANCIFEILAELIVMIIFIYAPQIMGAWFRIDGEIISVPLFNLSIWNQILPLFLIGFLLGIAENVVKMLVGKYTKNVMWFTIIINTVSLIVTFILVKGHTFLNPEFVDKIGFYSNKIINSKQDILSYWDTSVFTNFVMGIFFFIYLLQIGTVIYYTFRYGEGK